MKRLFTIQGNKSLIYSKSLKLFILADFRSIRNGEEMFLDLNGNVVDPPPEENDPYYPQDYNDDPAQVTPIVNGFYVYTTQEYTEDVDGIYGCFGIKDGSGRKITDEMFYQAGSYSNGLCAVRLKDSGWGYVDENGKLVIPYSFSEESVFNKYGVAVGDDSLIDMQGNMIEDTKLNFLPGYDWSNRYIEITLLTEEQCESIERCCGTAPGIMTSIYDTKKRGYVIRDIPSYVLDVDFFDGEPAVILSAATLIGKYDRISLYDDGIIVAEKEGETAAYDHYQ